MARHNYALILVCFLLLVGGIGCGSAIQGVVEHEGPVFRPHAPRYTSDAGKSKSKKDRASSRKKAVCETPAESLNRDFVRIPGPTTGPGDSCSAVQGSGSSGSDAISRMSDTFNEWIIGAILWLSQTFRQMMGGGGHESPL